MPKIFNKATVSYRQFLYLAVMVVLIYVLFSQIGNFSHSLHLLSHSSHTKLLLAAACSGLTYIFAAATYYFLALHPIRFRRTVVVQLAALLVNKLFPAGIGAIGTNFLYLKQNRHSSSQAAVITGLNNLLGLAGHLSLVLVSVAIFHQALPGSPLQNTNRRLAGLIILVTLVIIGVTLFWPKVRTKVVAFTADFKSQISSYRRNPFKLVGAYGSSILLTLANVITLLLCLNAVGGGLSFVAVLLVFSLGIGAGAAIPTPGGLGGVEAGLAAGLIAYHIPHDRAIATVVAFRLITYWLALLVGLIAFWIVQRRHYLG